MGNQLEQLLRQEYQERKLRNSSYSLRAFARYLGIGIASLSDLLQGKRGLSPKNKIKIAEKLHLSPAQRQAIFLEKSKNLPPVIDEETFKYISDWYHYGILVLPEIDNHKTTPLWVSKKLGISLDEAKEAIERLIKLKLIKKEKSKFIIPKLPFTTTKDIPSTAIRKRHIQILERGKDAIVNRGVNERFFFETTMAIDPDKIEEAKNMIIKYMRRVCKKLETGKQKEIYSLTTGLFPLGPKDN